MSTSDTKRAQKILQLLKKMYKVRGPFTTWSNPLELLIATVLSAQCTDERVNKVTEKLFQKYITAKDYAHAKLPDLEKDIYSTGFYKSKARYLKGIGKLLLEKYNGQVPRRFEDLLTFPGVAKKTAHLIMAKAFHTFTGVAVDTHVSRVAPRLGFSNETIPEKIAQDLEKLFPPRQYLDVNEYLILHGRAVCKSKPKCPECVLRKMCPSAVTFYPQLKK